MKAEENLVEQLCSNGMDERGVVEEWRYDIVDKNFGGHL